MLGGKEFLLTSEFGVHPGVGDVSLCMGVCILKESEEVLRCIASLDYTGV